MFSGLIENVSKQKAEDYQLKWDNRTSSLIFHVQMQQKIVPFFVEYLLAGMRDEKINRNGKHESNDGINLNF